MPPSNGDLMPPKFLYFDLGKVLLDFDHNHMFQQMGDVAGIEASRVEEVLFAGGLQAEYESGRISPESMYEAFCRTTGTQPDREALAHAANDIFELNVSIVPLVAQLQAARYRMGILSNTCVSHWEHCRRRFRIVGSFSISALSYEIHVAKPDGAVFEAAARLAGVCPEEIFFADDNADNVAGAVAAGFDAVQYTTTPRLAADLRSRGVGFNY
ncbi:MAG: HAD family hydrolase [Planctomycetota bacterium]|jgi:putative hydrolase of the HAD superfamily